MLPFTVTDKAFINDSNRTAAPYRVLAEASNYVLLAKLIGSNSSDPSRTPWTRFVVLTTSGSNMNYHSCGAMSMDDGDHAFQWTREKLLAVFRTSCFVSIKPDARFPFGSSETGPGWSHWRYQRR